MAGLDHPYALVGGAENMKRPDQTGFGRRLAAPLDETAG
jgi:hypothetical protein